MMDTSNAQTACAFAPRSPRVKRSIGDMLARAGVEVDGRGPASIRVFSDQVYEIAATRGFTGLREAYVDGLWDAERLDVVTDKVLSSRAPIAWSDRASLVIGGLAGRLLNRQARSRNAQSRRHYDLGNDLYCAMLDRRMIYSCAYWKDATSLEEAQESKLDLVCKKLGLAPGMRVLDIGCGWGGLARFAAERYGVSVVGITISERQARLAALQCKGLPIEIRVQDYRDLPTGSFDRLVSLGMLEHVGHRNYRRYLKVARNSLVDDGLFLLHTIGGNVSMTAYDEWMNDNVFPNAMLPSLAQIAAAAEGLFAIEDCHNLGSHYDPTLLAWFENFDRSWAELRPRYDDRFYRIWKCYLLTCAGAFRARESHVWQLVLSPFGVRGGYVPPHR